ncbi:MAG: DUF3060 domain-containing protein [Actinomyces sp.]|uniref:DUF3060 domain-containing protein n=1 Tax=Actinomyces sp. TaxID=29317 RepID=UPI0026DD204C|nr:DUF3060 domain-containing protein [Actinomyces sp.]MDO4243120.1 DUF3060 domain-containing protein [Actinomyces sp.]
MTRATRPLTLLTCGALALALSACSVTIGLPADEPAAQSSSAASAESGSAVAAAGDSGAATTGTLASPGAASPAASAGSTPTADAARSTGTAASSEDRPGAQVTITDDDWLNAEQNVDQVISAGDGTVVITEDNADVRIEGDVTSLTIMGSNVWLVADYVESLVVVGGNASVYVRDLGTVEVRGANADVVWAGNTPVVTAVGANTETRRQGED